MKYSNTLQCTISKQTVGVLKNIIFRDNIDITWSFISQLNAVNIISNVQIKGGKCLKLVYWTKINILHCWWNDTGNVALMSRLSNFDNYTWVKCLTHWKESIYVYGSVKRYESKKNNLVWKHIDKCVCNHSSYCNRFFSSKDESAKKSLNSLRNIKT